MKEKFWQIFGGICLPGYGVACLRALVLYFIFSLCAVIFLAREDSLNAQSYRVSSIEVIGNERVDTPTVIGHAGINEGDNLTAAELNAAFKSLQKSGLFEKVTLNPKGQTLIIEVKEFPTINSVSFEGQRACR